MILFLLFQVMQWRLAVDIDRGWPMPRSGQGGGCPSANPDQRRPGCTTSTSRPRCPPVVMRTTTRSPRRRSASPRSPGRHRLRLPTPPSSAANAANAGASPAGSPDDPLPPGCAPTSATARSTPASTTPRASAASRGCCTTAAPARTGPTTPARAREAGGWRGGPASASLPSSYLASAAIARWGLARTLASPVTQPAPTAAVPAKGGSWKAPNSRHIPRCSAWLRTVYISILGRFGIKALKCLLLHGLNGLIN